MDLFLSSLSPVVGGGRLTRKKVCGEYDYFHGFLHRDVCACFVFKDYLNSAGLGPGADVIQSRRREVMVLARQFPGQERWASNDADSFIVPMLAEKQARKIAEAAGCIAT